MKEFCKWYRIIFMVVLVVVALFSFVPKCFGYTGYVIETGSMEPTISIGSVVYVRECDLKLNDIVTYKSNDQLITHRIVGVDEMNRTLITKGDAHKYNDDYKVSVSDVLGKVEYSIPFVGYCVMYLQSLEGIVSTILLFLVFIGCNFYKERDVKYGSKEV